MPSYFHVPVIVNRLADVGQQLGFWANQNTGVLDREEAARQLNAGRQAEYNWQNLALQRHAEEEDYRRQQAERAFRAELDFRNREAAESKYRFGKTMDFQRAEGEANRAAYDARLESQERIRAADNAERERVANLKALQALDEFDRKQLVALNNHTLAWLDSKSRNPSERLEDKLKEFKERVKRETGRAVNPNLFFNPTLRTWMPAAPASDSAGVLRLPAPTVGMGNLHTAENAYSFAPTTVTATNPPAKFRGMAGRFAVIED